MRQANEIKIGAILSYVIIGIQAVLGIAYVPFLTHTLGQGEYGLYSLVASIISYMTLLDFGFGQAIIVYSSKNIQQQDKEHEFSLYGTFFLIYCFIAILAVIIGFFIYNNISLIFGANMSADEIETLKILFIILTFNVTITFLLSIFGNIITSYEKFIFSKCVQILKLIMQPLMVVPLLLYGSNSTGLVVIITIVNLICLLINTFYCIFKLKIKLKFKKLNNILFKEIVGFSLLVFLSDMVDKVNMFANNIILGAFCGATIVAVYAVAIQFVQIYRSFSFAISGVLLPRSSKMESNNAKDDDFSDLFIQSGRLQFIVLALILSGFLLFGKQVISLLFGESYIEAYYVASILMAALIIPQSQTVGINIILSKNKNLFRACLYVLIAVVNIIVCCFIASDYGAVGTSLVTAGAYLIGNIIIMNIYYARYIKLNMKKWWIEIIKITIVVIVVYFLSLIIIEYIGDRGVIVMLFEMLLFCLIYCLISWLVIFTKEEKNLILKGWINKKKSI